MSNQQPPASPAGGMEHVDMELMGIFQMASGYHGTDDGLFGAGMNETLDSSSADVGMIGMLPTDTSDFSNFVGESYMQTSASPVLSPPDSSNIPAADATMMPSMVGVDHDFQAMAIRSPLTASSSIGMPAPHSHDTGAFANPSAQASNLQRPGAAIQAAARSSAVSQSSTSSAGPNYRASVATSTSAVSSNPRNAASSQQDQAEDSHNDDDEEDDDHDESTGYSKAGRSKPAKSRALSASSPYVKPAAPASASGKPVDKKKRRLARKAELARQSRRRKKMYVHDLEAKVKELGAKIEELQRKNAKAKADQRLRNLPREEKERRDRQAHIREDLARRIKQSSFTQKEKSEVASLVRQFVLNSRERQSRFDLLMDQVSESIVPGLQVKFALWGLDQDEDFYRTSGLWTTLMRDEVQLTDAQLRSITSERVLIRQERERLAECERLLGRLQTLVTQHFNGLNQRMDRLMQILLPLQIAKYYMWVESNEWCMQMLDSMYLSLPEHPPDV